MYPMVHGVEVYPDSGRFLPMIWGMAGQTEFIDLVWVALGALLAVATLIGPLLYVLIDERPRPVRRPSRREVMSRAGRDE